MEMHPVKFAVYRMSHTAGTLGDSCAKTYIRIFGNILIDNFFSLYQYLKLLKETTVNSLIQTCVDFFKKGSFPFAICAGYALDLFVGRQIRPHSDIDVWISKEDQQKSLEYVFNDGWQIYENHGKGVFKFISNPYEKKVERFTVLAVKPDSTFAEFKREDDGNYKLIVK
jgi:hypothetical protein